ncbi:ribose-phosphate diphosphokinase [Legionella bozemanae]|uniref:ribose-phosphate diphosphokinase n=1 Tax=Legionella bozemanae TaxID=447 RepID=UPI00399C808F
MDNPILFSLPGNKELTQTLSNKLSIEIGKAEIHTFPDSESYIRINSEVKNKKVFLVCTLDHPNSKILPLIFMARTLKELGANKICLVAPYLAYMRQDKRFHSGEAITSTIFAQLLSSCIDGMITIDPHLHRIHQLSEIYSMPSLLTLHATKNISEWISSHIKNPILIGPDEESKQWVSEIANFSNLSFVIAQKKRLDDKRVAILLPEIKGIENTPVLVDDIISSGVTMFESLKQLRNNGFKNPICIGVHALFNNQTENMLLSAGAKQLVTCNTIIHSTNQIDVSDILAKGIIELY